ncbi:hypothetical protein FRC01_004095, partial [Tulasnella sp. 417]
LPSLLPGRVDDSPDTNVPKHSKGDDEPTKATSQPPSEFQEAAAASPEVQRRSRSAQPHPRRTRSEEQMMAELMKAAVSR